LLNTPPANKEIQLSGGKSFKTNEYGQVEEVTFTPVAETMKRDSRGTAMGKEGLSK